MKNHGKTANHTPKPYGIYARASKLDGGERLTIAQQVDDGMRWINEHGHTHAGTYIDDDFSGALPPTQFTTGKRAKNRPALTRLLTDIEAGKVGGIVARKSDRLGRMATGLGLQMYQWFADHSVDIILTTEKIPNISTADGKLQLTMMIAFASFQREQIAENIRVGKAYAKRQGMKTSGAVLFGYEDGEARGTVNIDEERAGVAKEIFQRYAGGESIYGVTKWLTSRHPRLTVSGKKWNRQTVKAMLKNPLYIGLVPNTDEELIKSKAYPAIIDEAVFYDVQLKLKANGNVKHGDRYNPKYVITGLLKCHCGERMIIQPEDNKQYGGVRYNVLQCPAPHKDGTRPRRMDESEWNLFLDTYASTLKINAPAGSNVADMLRIEKMESNLAAYKKMAAANDITPDDYLEFSKGIKENIAKIRATMLSSEAVASSTAKPWGTLNVAEKRQYLFETVDKLIAFHDGVMLRLKPNVLTTTIRATVDKQPATLYFPFILKRQGTGKNKLGLVGRDKGTFSMATDTMLGAWANGVKPVFLKTYPKGGERLASYTSPAGMKICPRCEQEKPLAAFWQLKGGRVFQFCKVCGTKANNDAKERRKAGVKHHEKTT